MTGETRSAQLKAITDTAARIYARVNALGADEILQNEVTTLLDQLSAARVTPDADDFSTQAHTAQLETANQALHDANAYLRVIFDSIKDYAVFTIDLDNRITHWNTGAERVFGWTDDEAVGQSAAMIFTPEDRAQHAPEEEILTAIERGYAEDKRWHLRKDGSRFFASGTLRQLLDPQDRLRGFIKVARDATVELERQQAQDALAADLRDLQILHNLSVQLVPESDVQAFYDGIMAAAISLTQADTGTVHSYDEMTHELVLLSSQGLDPDMQAYLAHIDVDTYGPCSVATKTGQRTFYDLETSADFDPDSVLHKYLKAGHRAVQSIPLITRTGRPIGVFSTHWRTPHQPSERERRFLDLLARQAADLIERQQTESALRESRARLEAALDAAHMTTWEWYPETDQTITSPSATEVFGLEADMTLNSSADYYRLIYTQDRERYMALVQHAVESVKNWHTEFRIVRPRDGQVAWLEERANVSHDPKTGRIRTTGLIWDITERKDAEAQLRGLEQRRLLTVEATGVGDWQLDLQTGIAFWSPRTFELFGLPPEDMPSFERILALIHPEDQQQLLEARSAALKGFNEGKYVAQYRVIRPDGTIRWIEGRAQVVFSGPPDQQQSVQIIGTIIDITLQKQVEAQEREQRVLAEALRDTAAELSSTLKLDELLTRALVLARRFATCDAAYIVLIDNAGVFGHLQADLLSVQERQTLEAWHRRHSSYAEIPIYQATAQTALVQRHKGRPDELPLRMMDELLVVPLAQQQEVIAFLVLINRQRSGFVRANLAALQAFSYQLATAISNAKLFVQAQDLAALQERQQFARDLHDAVSQTLFAASLLIEALPMHWDNRSNEVPQLLSDVNRLIKGAQAEMRTLLLELRPVNLQSTPLRRLFGQLIDTAQGRTRINVALAFEGEPILPWQVHVAVYRIAQEALNNIAKHAQAAHAWVAVSGGNNRVELHIRDDGAGFALNSARAGLGLQMMRERAELIGATLDVVSEPGKGTEIRLRWADAESLDTAADQSV